MPVLLKMSAVKRFQSRSTSYSYKDLEKVFNDLDWKYEVIPPAVMIVHFQKEFPDTLSAVAGRRELEARLKLVHRNVAYRLDSATDT